MFLSRTNIALFVASVVASAASVTSAEYLRDHDDHRHEKKAVFSKEKGFKCHGGGTRSEFGKECEGGMKMEFEISTKPMDVVWNVVEEVHTQLDENFIPDAEFLMPSDDVLDDWMAASSSEGLEEGKSMTMEFGGTAKVEWGCKVTYSRKEGKFSKSAACGFKGSSKSGKKDPEQEDELAENVMFM